MTRFEPIHPSHCACKACQPPMPGEACLPPLRWSLILAGPALALACLLLGQWWNA